MSAPPKPNPKPTPGPRPVDPNADLLAKEGIHQAAAALTAGVMAGFQLPLASLDPTFADQNLRNAISVAVGVHKTFYAWLAGAVQDPSWLDPVQHPTPTPAPVTPPSPALTPAANLGSLVSSITGS